MKIRNSNMPSKRNSSELRSGQSNNYNRTNACRMKTNNSSIHAKRRANYSACLWRRAMSIIVLLQILVNCGKFNYSYAHFIFLFFWIHNEFMRNSIHHSYSIWFRRLSIGVGFLFVSFILFFFFSIFHCEILVASLPHFHSLSDPFVSFFLLSGALHSTLLNSE